MKSNSITKYLLCIIVLGISLSSQAQFITGGAGKTILQNSGDNVGIGTANPAFVIDVQRAGNASMNFKSTSGTANLILDRFNSAATSSVSYRTNGTPTWQTGTVGTDNFVVRNIALGSPAIAVDALTNNVGVGINLPTANLHVQKAGNTSALIRSTGDGAQLVIDRSANGYEAVTRYTQQGVPQWKTGLTVNALGTYDFVIANEITSLDAMSISVSNSNVNFRSGMCTFGVIGTNDLGSISQSGNNLSLSTFTPTTSSGSTPGNIIMAFTNLFGFKSGNVGIGTNDPSRAKLVVQGKVGSTNAIFGQGGTGISLVQNSPSIGFNSYYGTSSWKSMAAGYGAKIFMDPSNGVIYFGGTTASATGADQSFTETTPMAITPDGRVIISSTNYTSTLAVKKVATAADAAAFQGTTLYSHFAFGNNEDTYIRGGLSSSNIIIADLCNNVGIGTANPAYKLDVCGTMRAKEVRVATGWCDYVFADDYKLPSLNDVETFIKANKHLPDVTPGSVIEGEGLEVGKTSAQMIKKIEELTLYVIDLQKQVNELKKDKN